MEEALTALTRFVLDHGDDDTARLLLSRSKWPDIDMDLAVSTIESRRRLRTKLPSWYAVPTLLYPSSLSAEQSSGEPAARHKAALAASIPSEPTWAPAPLPNLRVADLTGGMGVDSWAFAEVAEEVLYNEMNESLVEAARHNFRELGVENVRFSCREVVPGSISGILGDFKPDVVFLDPARRGTGGGKVFRLEDCSPNVLPLMPELLDACPHVLLKLSPMADITLVTKQLPEVREVHLIEATGECKELLLHIHRGWTGGYTITATVLTADTKAPAITPSATTTTKATVTSSATPGFTFTPQDEAGAAATFAAPLPGQQLFEPGKALLKSGAFKLISSRFHIGKLAPSTHLYVADTIPEELAPLGRVFTITHVLPFGKTGFRECLRLLPDGRAEVSSHNIPLTSDDLRRKIGCTSGGPTHIFAAPSLTARHLILATRH